MASVMTWLRRWLCGGEDMIEKPFGRDLASARLLNRTLFACFDERRIFRMGSLAKHNWYDSLRSILLACLSFASSSQFLGRNERGGDERLR
jgi:hypothetical protein